MCSQLLDGVLPALTLVAFVAGELRGRAAAARITQTLGLQVRGGRGALFCRVPDMCGRGCVRACVSGKHKERVGTCFTAREGVGGCGCVSAEGG